MSYKEIETILNKYGLHAKKKFGQNFLIDDNILKTIATSLYKENNQVLVIEIGPGIGSLTKELTKYYHEVLAYEIDSDMVNVLNKEFSEINNLEVIQKDYLKADVKTDIKNIYPNNQFSNIYMIANLPYYITSPILVKTLEQLPFIENIVVMVQKEVGERFLSKPKTKDYNALSVLMQYYTNITKVINVSSSCFTPKPNVDSIVIRLEKKNKEVIALNEEFFFQFNKIIFVQRRKTIINNLKNFNFKQKVINKELIEKVFGELNYQLSIRAEELDVNQIIELSNKFYLSLFNEN